MKIGEAVSAVLSELEKVSTSDAVVGKPVKVGESVVIPVSRLRLGFGVGVGDIRAGQSVKEGAVGTGAAGGGVSVDPLAFIVVDPNGIANLLSLRDSAQSLIAQAIQLVPEVAEKVAKAGAEFVGGSGEGEAKPKPPAKKES